jgi:hypothetical protein
MQKYYVSMDLMLTWAHVQTKQKVLGFTAQKVAKKQHFLGKKHLTQMTHFAIIMT